MKTIKIITLMLVIITSTLSVNAQNKRGVKDILKITGAALLNDQRATDYAISVFLDGTRVDSMYTKSKKTIKFYVTYNNVYTFLFQKEGCVDKIVIVNTKLPEGLKSIQDDTFDFEVEMSQSLSKNTKELEDYPVAVLLIDRKEEMLQASADYNKFTHTNSEVIKTEVSDKKSSKNQ
jgi:hypothetical protein